MHIKFQITIIYYKVSVQVEIIEKHGKRNNDGKTPKSLEMEQDDVIEVYQEQTEGGTDEAETEYVKLKVVGQDSNEIHFRVNHICIHVRIQLICMQGGGVDSTPPYEITIFGPRMTNLT